MLSERFEMIDDGHVLHESMKNTILNWIRDGGQVIHVSEAVQAAASAPADDPPSASRQKRHYTRKPKAAPGAKTSTIKFPIGARAYLRWTALDDAQKLHLSQYRTTTGQVEALPSRGKRTVRFNGDPPETFSVDQLSSAPYLE